MRSTLRTATLAVAMIATAALAGCSATTAEPADTEEAAASNGEWPRIIEHAAGTTEITEEPLVIVSTSVSLTGSLLSIDAPLVASAATSVNPLTDDQGFFIQWADIADERGVEVLYPNLELDLEAIELYEPDLIIGSSVGGDATIEAYDQLSEIAPTILLDYGSAPWTEITETLGEVTGLEANAAAVVDDFDAYVAEQAALVEPPAGPVALISYQGADGIGLFMPESPQASILTDMGFEYTEVPTDLASQVRSDAAFFTAENTPAALDGVETLFAIPLGGDPTEAIESDPLLANQTAVANGDLYITPVTTFRLDYYSATQFVDYLVAQFGA